jgi:hypothetical protein
MLCLYKSSLLICIASSYRGEGSHYPLYLFLCVLEYYLSYGRRLIEPYDIIRIMDEWTPNPICRLFFKLDLLTGFAALCLTDLIDWRYINSWLVFFTQFVNCCPPPPSHSAKIGEGCCNHIAFLAWNLNLNSKVIKYEKTRKEWRFSGIFYFVCRTFHYKDMTPQSLRKMRFSQNQQLDTTFTSQIRPEILI